MANQRKSKSKTTPKYIYQLADGTRYEINISENYELVTVLREMDRKERLSDRYELEAQDSLFNFKKNQYQLNPSEFFESPIEKIQDLKFSAEEVLFSEKDLPKLRDKVHNLIPLLIKDQQELWYLLCEGHKIVDIARILNTTPEATRSRIRKLRTRIKKLYQIKHETM